LRTRLAIETHTRRIPIVVEPSIARLAYGSADIVTVFEREGITFT
jgi:hypothetical protein